MTAPTAPLPGLLRVYATPEGFTAIRQQFTDEDIWEVITADGGNLLLAAADLLEALPVPDAGGGLVGFKLDVLEFKYSPGGGAQDWRAHAKGLRERADALTTARAPANPSPELQSWGIE